jgi:hypothetical protein
MEKIGGSTRCLMVLISGFRLMRFYDGLIKAKEWG